MEELLSEKKYICKPNSGLIMNCKFLSGLSLKNCKLFSGRDIPQNQKSQIFPPTERNF